eukprot:scaffold22740_cov129-Isochrysis_galbana.AAC.1
MPGRWPRPELRAAASSQVARRRAEGWTKVPSARPRLHGGTNNKTAVSKARYTQTHMLIWHMGPANRLRSRRGWFRQTTSSMD